MLTTFDDLVNECLKTGQPYRLLYVYVKLTTPPTDGGMGFSVAFDAHEPVKTGLTFAGMMATADAHNPDWDWVVVGVAHTMDGTQITDKQANESLAEMTKRILSGKLTPNTPIFDRTGKHLSIVKRPGNYNQAPLH